MSFSVRPYALGDAPAMAKLYYDAVHQVGARFYSAEQVAAWAPAPADPAVVHERATDGRATLVAENAAREVVGYGDLEACGHIDFLYCRPDVAGTGVASALVEAIIALARDREITRLHVEASEAARPLFEKKGFEVVQRRDFELRGVAIHNWAMARAL